MSHLSSDARSLLDQSKDVGVPNDEAIARVRASLLTSIETAAAATAIATTATKAVLHAPVAVAPTTTIAAIPFVGKAIAGVALFALVAAGGHAIANKTQWHRAPETSITVQAPKVSIAPVMTATPIVTAAQPPTPIDPPTPTQAHTQTSPSIMRTSSSSTPSALSEDTENLREAQADLVADNPQGALAAADRMSATGPLAEDREGVRILASCAIDPSSKVAKSSAQAFVDTHAQSPLALRIRTACLSNESAQ